jgi:hypothetical protein
MHMVCILPDCGTKVCDTFVARFLPPVIINITQAILENIQVSLVERSVIDLVLTHSLDCYQTQRGLCSAFGANPIDDTLCFKTAESIAERSHFSTSFSSFEYTLSLSL